MDKLEIALAPAVPASPAASKGVAYVADDAGLHHTARLRPAWHLLLLLLWGPWPLLCCHWPTAAAAALLLPPLWRRVIGGRL